MNLYTYLQKEKNAEKNLLENLDETFYARHVFSLKIIGQQDGRTVNYTVPKSNSGKLALICIDNERTFAPALISLPNKSHAIIWQDIHFCMPQLFKPIDPEARQRFLDLNTEAILKAWLQDIEIKHEEWQILFKDHYIHYGDYRHSRFGQKRESR